MHPGCMRGAGKNLVKKRLKNKVQWYQILKSARKNLGLSLREVEAKTDISNAYISQLENGSIREPGFFKMLRLLSLYKITIRDMGVATDR